MKSFSIIGARGAVGKEIFKLLKTEFEYPLIKLYGSKRSAGKYLDNIKIEEYKREQPLNTDITFLAVDGEFSKNESPFILNNCNTTIIDNSSAFRYDNDIPLIIPEINPSSIKNSKIIANPNCTTAIGIIPVYHINNKYGVKKMLVSSYQAASGAGEAAMEELTIQTKAYVNNEPLKNNEFDYPLLFNLIPKIDDVLENNYTKEEMKVVWETRKILNIPDMAISCTAVRIPVMRSHSLSIHLEVENKINSKKEIEEILKDKAGINLCEYPMPINSTKKNNVNVGRIRMSNVFKNGVEIFVSGDQLLKGAALNSVQIAKLL